MLGGGPPGRGVSRDSGPPLPGAGTPLGDVEDSGSDILFNFCSLTLIGNCNKEKNDVNLIDDKALESLSNSSDKLIT